LEEKCLFYSNRHTPFENVRASLGSVNIGRFSPSLVATLESSVVGTGHSEETNSTPKVFIPVHQHLLEQHRLGEYYVDDKDGKMTTPTINLSADFFHPSACTTTTTTKRKPRTKQSTPPPPRTNANDALLDVSDAVRLAPQPPVDPSDIGDILAAPHPFLEPALKLVEPEAYSADTPTVHSASKDDSQEVRKHMRSRFATYQRRLEGFMAKRDLAGFEECLLDLWDEFFPHSAGIHYYDTETPVPRISCMQKFLTKPCPKAIGVVQCEIERIKINSRGKAGVKGSVFPKYEYRLFIRNRAPNRTPNNENPESSAESESDDHVRRDTLLMVAKNRGRKHVESNGALPTASKKGSNNYYLYMPQQRDVDAHFNKANEHRNDSSARLIPNGASHEPVLSSDVAGSVLLGRLQSNFFGTEFQIFTPRLRSLPRQKSEPRMQQRMALSEDELDYDSGVSSDNASSRRSKRFGRLSLRRSSNHQGTSDMLSTGSNSSLLDRPPVVKRTLSSPELPHRQPRTNRRAIANDAKPPPQQSTMTEEVDGAITYTANLLGSRPRIMDVCIPKVTPEGVSGVEWKEYLENCEDVDASNMLNCFRQMQQRLDQDNHHNIQAAADGEEGDTETDFGLMALQNRPPWWNVELGSFVLNFGGRVSVASVKNFQLCERTDHDTIMLQFGRIDGRHSFTMDFQHPLTAVQAFSIAISSLQSKIINF